MSSVHENLEYLIIKFKSGSFILYDADTRLLFTVQQLKSNQNHTVRALNTVSCSFLLTSPLKLRKNLTRAKAWTNKYNVWFHLLCTNIENIQEKSLSSTVGSCFLVFVACVDWSYTAFTMVNGRGCQFQQFISHHECLKYLFVPFPRYLKIKLYT